jgi:hypothetical protein
MTGMSDYGVSSQAEGVRALAVVLKVSSPIFFIVGPLHLVVYPALGRHAQQRWSRTYA